MEKDFECIKIKDGLYIGNKLVAMVIPALFRICSSSSSTNSHISSTAQLRSPIYSNPKASVTLNSRSITINISRSSTSNWSDWRSWRNLWMRQRRVVCAACYIAVMDRTVVSPYWLHTWWISSSGDLWKLLTSSSPKECSSSWPRPIYKNWRGCSLCLHKSTNLLKIGDRPMSMMRRNLLLKLTWIPLGSSNWRWPRRARRRTYQLWRKISLRRKKWWWRRVASGFNGWTESRNNWRSKEKY